MHPLESAIWAVFGLSGALFVYKPVSGWLRSSAWKVTEGNIISTSIYEDMAGDEVRYRPQVAYWYSVDGQPRRGDQITFGSPDQSSAEKAKKLLMRYEGKATVKVFYNPANPEEAVLERALAFATWMGLALVTGAFAGAVYVLFNGTGEGS